MKLSLTMACSPIDIERFLCKVELALGPLEDECWLWTGAKSRGQGNLQWYGSFSVNGVSIRAHKFSYVFVARRLWYAERHLDHLCERSLCVNPRHLEMVTREVNQERKGRELTYDHRH